MLKMLMILTRQAYKAKVEKRLKRLSRLKQRVLLEQAMWEAEHDMWFNEDV